MLLQGLFVPLICPFTRDGASSTHKLRHNVARYTLGPAAGLVALLPGGEASGLTDAETLEYLEAVAQAARKEKVLLAGVQRASVVSAVALTREAERAGFDAILLAPPPDWARLVRSRDAREIILFYEAVADRSPLPVVLWSDAQVPALQLPVSVVQHLAQHPNIIGLMDADLDAARFAELSAGTAAVRRDVTVTTIFEAVTRRMLRTEAPSPATPPGMIAVEALAAGSASAATAIAAPPVPALKVRTRQVGFQIVSAGRCDAIVPLLRAGVAGAMPQLAACAPQACFEAYAAWKDGDQALAEERAGRLGEAETLLAGLGAAGLKAGCDFNGYFGGLPRLPRVPLTAQQRGELEAALAPIRN